MFCSGTCLCLVPAKLSVYLGLVERQAAAVGQHLCSTDWFVLLAGHATNVSRNGRVMGRALRWFRSIIFYIPAADMVASSRFPIHRQDSYMYFLVGININGSSILEIRSD